MLSGRLSRWLSAWRRTPSDPAEPFAASIAEIDGDLGRLSIVVERLQRHAEATSSHLADQLVQWQADARTRATMAALPRARVGRATGRASLSIDGTPGQRLHVARLTRGEPIERPFSGQMGITRCVTLAGDVRALWERLLAAEAMCGNLLRAEPSTVLDVPGATVSAPPGGPVSVSLARNGAVVPTRRERLVAVPLFTYDYLPKKLGNFGHWLLDCVPQALVLADIAPDATFLLPQQVRGFHRSTLAMVGVGPEQCVVWDGSPIACDRLLLFEDDGRVGGGRPLSSLMELRRRLGVADRLAPRGTRRLYVSRRDAREQRRWVSNQEKIETVFRRRGFEVLTMADCSLEQQAEAFGNAAVVAGISGAGLADLVFAAPGTDVLVLHTDSLMRWYAREEGTKSAWMKGADAFNGSLAALGDSPRFYAHLAAVFEQRCHSFVSADEVPADALGEFVDAVLTPATVA